MGFAEVVSPVMIGGIEAPIWLAKTARGARSPSPMTFSSIEKSMRE